MIGKRAAQKGGGEAHRRMGSTGRRRPRPWRRSAEEESPEVGIAAADESREERRRERDLGLGDPGDDGGLEEKGCWAEFGLSGISEK